jgi:hypothetical protein
LIFLRQGADTGCLNQAASYAHSGAAKVVKGGDFRGFVGRHVVLAFVGYGVQRLLHPCHVANAG